MNISEFREKWKHFSGLLSLSPVKGLNIINMPQDFPPEVNCETIIGSKFDIIVKLTFHSVKVCMNKAEHSSLEV